MYLGFSWDYCMTPVGDDQDADGVRDSCEYQLAYAFRPWLRIMSRDRCPERESYWSAAREPSANVVKIFYLLSYHKDCGNFEPHNGDSEFVVLYVAPPTNGDGRWKLRVMTTSAHYGAVTNSTASVYYYSVEYPEVYRSAPRVYVALDKHANYYSDAECDAGAWYYDKCDDPSFHGRVEVLPHADGNIGNNWARTGDIQLKWHLYSRWGQPGVETPWGGFRPDGTISNKFCGWQDPSAGPCAGTYAITLRDYGF